MAPPSLEPPAPGIPMKGERWRQQRILELEVYLRRIDLLQDQVAKYSSVSLTFSASVT
ncbi:hypothetical protein OsJ_10997 [Oryza sativa Japonica Group]|uniref:Uncharacterized protein n=1 Tax=Oryza sativa subsp. japonica TaxID=39947 RepID=A3AIC9_ORYSJ|nr:hypothetical protein OsJ_10997 [Oryza sativa Japonica Group]